MDTKQINLKLPKNLVTAAESYAKNYGFRNVQELAAASLRENIFEKNMYDEQFSQKEIELIDQLLVHTTSTKELIDEKELNALLE